MPVLQYFDIDPQVHAALYAAARAPSVNCWQPWGFQVSGDRIVVLPTDESGPRISDEDLFSCGAAIFNLRVGLQASGRASSTELAPQDHRGTKTTKLATVTVLGTTRPGLDDLALYRAISHWRPGFFVFDDQPVPTLVSAALIRAARAEGTEITLSPRQIPMIAELAATTGTPPEYLRLGQAVQRMRLTAGAAGLSATFECRAEPDYFSTRLRIVLRFGYRLGAAVRVPG